MSHVSRSGHITEVARFPFHDESRSLGLGTFQLSRPYSLRLLTKTSWLGIISKNLEETSIKRLDREGRIDTVQLTKVIDKHVKA
jgi:hypothetical protein